MHFGSKPIKKTRWVVLTVCALRVAAPVWADDGANDAGQFAQRDGWLHLLWNARLRHEQVDDDAYARTALAETLRLRLGLRADLGSGWSSYLEGAGTASAGNHYNSGANAQTQYPVINDPRGTQLNQVWVRWQGSQIDATVGRQELVLDNQRWVGNVDWRQFEQTFDAVALQWQPARNWTVHYDWLDHVYRVAGPDAINPLASARDLDTNLLNAAYVRGTQQWVGYVYLHDDHDVATASTGTYGLRWSGKPIAADGGFGWTLEAARQVDYANNPLDFAHSYWLLEPAWRYSTITAKLGWEHLGGDGSHALQTPLATLHTFNGWDDQFLTTPAGGLEDRYANITGAPTRASDILGKLGWVVAYHDFHAVHGGRYGNEWDASLMFPLAPGLQGLLKAADYRADGFGRNDTKLWLQLEWKGQHDL
ncbi:MAG: alginate export family protein [Rudaea sp.]